MADDDDRTPDRPRGEQPDRPRREQRGGRPRDAARGDRPNGAPRSDQPGRSDRPFRSGQQGGPERPRRADRTGQGSGSDRPYRAGQQGGGGERPRRADRSDRPLRPERGDRTGERPRRDSTRDAGRPVVRAPGDRSRHAAGPRDDRRAARPPAHRDDARPRRDDPPIPEDVRPGDLDRAARIELKTLTKENADEVARHLVMAARLIDDDPQLAHRHALAAAGRAGRIAIVRESLAITAYAIGDFALALRELRTFRRISGSDDQIALMVDSERGIGRPDRALELGRSVDRENLPLEAKVGLAIAMSGARLDQGDPRGALDELERAPIDLTRVHPWSPELFLAFAAVHEDLGQAEEAERWNRRAARAAALLDEVDEESTSVEVVDEPIEVPETAEDAAPAVEPTDVPAAEPEAADPAAGAEPGEQDR